MSFLRNARIRTKVVAVIALTSFISLAGLCFISLQYENTDTVYSDFISNDATAAMLNARATGNLLQMGFQLSLVTLTDPASKEFGAAVMKYDADRDQIKKRIARSAELVPSRAEPVAKMLQGLTVIEAAGAKVISLAKAGQKVEAQQLMLVAGNQIMELLPLFASGNDQMMKAMTDGSDELTERTNSTILTTMALLVAVTLAAIGFGLFVASRGITGPIDKLRARMLSLAGGETQEEIAGLGRKDEVGQMAEAVAVFRDNALERIRLEQEAEANRSLGDRERIERERQKAKEAADVQFAVDSLAAGLSHLSDGDVSYRLTQTFVESLDGVRKDFNASAEKLQAALVLVAQNARGIDAGANEIRSAADDLAKRTEQQAAAVEETAAALEQITTTVKDSARRAQEAGELVSRTRSGAERSGEVVRHAVVAMERIEKSSSEIGNIIGVIDEIAFQTNLLALNAGVEAARAGDAGKGFAVVAQEVRELAQRSANAAKEIKALVTTSNAQVQEGVQLVGDTGRALATIVSEVQEINGLVVAIVEAAQEQSSGLQQINTAVNQMDQDTQKNAAMVEETTAASHGLAKEAVSLNQLLAQFKLSETGYAGSAPATASAAPVRAARTTDAPAASPVRALGRKLTAAFSGNAAIKDEWEEF
ncbi:methyl-accepting chemotaxis sensory transducer with TarH sensor [Rhizobium subbaraonis]|uniref:Methyl-accepting chemotaxis sensory transducer with TarH sensor n=1 Tax=Rhizobium subbaraonis TaxID=908946 RepID=A0A285TYW3_9HYPH|nr:methyl-accepting chemotaxis protein [Rhizobium subbaraonis]SOC34769.1 methyl-accepting chemotaxis sensory transducer with TarH sensor [Rhizobium subbaraonis]